MNRLKTRLRTRGAVAATALTAMLVGGLVTSTPTPVAQAASNPSPVQPAPANMVTADGLPTVQIDGVVWSQAIVGNTVYAGGKFANARPAGAAPGTNLTTRNNLLAYNLTTGELITSFAPNLNAQVLAVAASPDGSRIYVAGDFTTANGQTRNRVAAYSTATGGLISSFAPVVNSQVKAIVATNDTVYVGGGFAGSGGTLRGNLAAFRASDGALLGWNPNADYTVWALALSSDSQSVLAGGSFQNVGGTPAYGLVKIDAVTGAVQPWNATNTVRNAGVDAGITSLTVSGAKVFGTTYHFGPGGNLEGPFRADVATGDVEWVVDCHGDSYDTHVQNGVVYSVGHPHYCGNVGGGYPQKPQWTFQHTIAFSTDATGTHEREVHGYPNWEGFPSPSIVNWLPIMGMGTASGQNQAGWTVTGNADYTVVGGEFPTVNNVGQQGLVRFARKPIAPAKQGPLFIGGQFTPRLTATSPTSVRIAWQAGHDRDDYELTYKVVRNNAFASPVHTTTGNSNSWTFPMLGYVDSGLTPGATYSYQLIANDDDGNTVFGSKVNITMPTSVPSNAYVDEVIADGASLYWPLDEPSGTGIIDRAGPNDGVALAGVTRGVAGIMPGETASTLQASQSGRIYSKGTMDAPDVFTIQAWIRTTTTNGGRILGFSDLTQGNSGHRGRHVYMDNSGRITFGVHNSSIRTLRSSLSYNDGQWHQVVATLGPDGMKLYVDAKRVGQRSDTTAGEHYLGYWRLGGDNLGGWPNRPSNDNFGGSIDEVSIYPTVLSRSQIVDQWVASGRTSPTQPTPADAYGAAVYQEEPDLYWRLGEASGSVASDAGPLGNNGSYVGGNTKGQSGALTGVANTAVLLNGSTGLVASDAQFTNPATYSVETWFKTTTTRGGKLIGFGDSRTGISSNYDRHVYMQNNGRLVFGVWTGQANTITTPTSYNDGQWHHLVATQSGAGMAMYVDGIPVGTNPQGTNQNYSGYWKFGGDNLNGWPNPPTSRFLAGTFDEAAVYSTALSAQRVAEHYTLGGGTIANQAPTAAFTSSTDGLEVSVDGSGSSDADGTVESYSWDFDDGGSATGATASHTYASAGTYDVTLTVTDDDGDTDTETKQVTVTDPPQNEAPTAAFTSSTDDLDVTVDGSGSSDADGTVESFSWDFGDGGSATGATASHTYASAGTYDVTLTVTDDDGDTDTETKQVTVTANQAPTAAFISSTDDLEVSVDGSGSSDPDGTVESYSWDFDDGGSATGATASHTYAAAGTYDVTLTVTDDDGATDTETEQVTVTAPAGPHAADTFERSVTGGLGTADVGGTWSHIGSSTNVSVSGGTGNLRMNSAGNGPTALLNSVSARNVDATIDVSFDKLPTGNGIFASLITRRDGTSDYRAKARLLPDRANLQISRVVNGAETVLVVAQDATTPYQLGDVLRLRVAVVGSGTTTLSAKLWKVGDPEPADWQLTTTDTTSELQGPGGTGMQTFLSGSSTNAPVMARFDNLSVLSAQ